MSASVVVERAGPLLGALVATLPVTVWPAYVFLSLANDASFVAASARSSLAVTAVTAISILLYGLAAQRYGVIASLTVTIGSWIGLARLTQAVDWSVSGALLLNLGTFPVCIAASRHLCDAKVPKLTRQWYELPLRTVLVCVLMAMVIGLGNWLGPAATGLLAAYPISTTCMILVLHARIGGRASAAVLANALWGIAGVGWSLYALSIAIQVLDPAPALALALIVPLGWNLSVWTLRS